jgi:hypothetical protein
LPHPQPTWLVVRNVHRQALESRQLGAGVVLVERGQRTAAGWPCEDIGYVCSLFFATRDGTRIQVGMERYDPDGPGHPSHSG